MSAFITTPHEWIDSLIHALVEASYGGLALSPDSVDDLAALCEAAGHFLTWGYGDYPDPVLLSEVMDDVVRTFDLGGVDYTTLFQYLLDLMQFHHHTLTLCVGDQHLHRCEAVIINTHRGWRLVGWHLIIQP